MTKEEIDRICKRYDIRNYKINLDGSIDVDGNVNISTQNLIEIPLIFNWVSGTFDCSRNKLTSLYGCPRTVDGNFYCSNNHLESLQYAPHDVSGNFYCRDNKLTSLKGAPKQIGGNFYCFGNRLTSLLYAPKKVWGDFNCSENRLTNLDHLPVFGGVLIIYSNDFDVEKLYEKLYKMVDSRKYFTYKTFETLKNLLPYPSYDFIKWVQRHERLKTIQNIIDP